MSDKSSSPVTAPLNASATPSRAALPRTGFTFKQFFVAHDRCAMKVGTDGILLGAWASLQGVTKVLDIGTGTGLIALMLAQRSPSDTQITAIDIDADACQQAAENVAASPWPDKILIQHLPLQQLAAEASAEQFDLIVSNPPYFTPGVACRDNQREQARYTDTLTHQALLDAARPLLNPLGRLCLVLPYSAGLALQSAAEQQGWFCYQNVSVSSREGKAPQRILLEFGLSPQKTQNNTLVINNSDGSYHCNYQDLTKDFYLFM
ncbi:tRNA1(Val) (adenine(37)-N6)-methyltransferase [Plesiomonas shigelloides]|uniref:tRNA1(Val) (adenine(37)-N6)-methyltransferase n=1 Tax=Plesiomonas shigelloides 302-73 TaxID=1315976 RepID=R8AMS2_PLESH|nr:tRNA1(Val) (adenine(37)-N6)-methyltransferase [Plesiomonas shigelloides]EON87610.1 tRNA (adenine-N(6)-)-methyltransferase [Plesiomonas shigelloides 302-73]